MQEGEFSVLAALLRQLWSVCVYVCVSIQKRETIAGSTNVWEDSADTGLQVIGCEGKQRSFGWFINSQCGEVCDCNSQFSVCLRVELS